MYFESDLAPQVRSPRLLRGSLVSHSLLILKIRTGSQVRSSPGFYGGTGKVRFMITGRCLCGRSDGKHRPGTAYGHGVFFMRPVGWEAPARYGLRSRRAFYAAGRMGSTGEVRLKITARCLCGPETGGLGLHILGTFS